MYRFNQVGKSGFVGVYLSCPLQHSQMFFIYSDSQDFPVINWRPRSDLDGVFEGAGEGDVVENYKSNTLWATLEAGRL